MFYVATFSLYFFLGEGFTSCVLSPLFGSVLNYLPRSMSMDEHHNSHSICG